jgi:hypothetical protein
VLEQADDTVATFKGMNGEGKPILIKYTVPSKGGTLVYSEGHVPEGMTIALARIDSNTAEFDLTLNGKHVMTDHCVLSADANTITLTRIASDADGEHVVGVEIYDRQ